MYIITGIDVALTIQNGGKICGENINKGGIWTSNKTEYTEFVDIYLLDPDPETETETEILPEIKNLTDLRPRNTQMHLVREIFPRNKVVYYEIPSQKFSSRNTEILLLKRRLLKKYLRHLRNSNGSHYYDPCDDLYDDDDDDDEEEIVEPDQVLGPPRTNPKMSARSRIRYITKLWPQVARSHGRNLSDYYGLEVTIISEEEREEKEKKKKKVLESPKEKKVIVEEQNQEIQEEMIETRHLTKAKESIKMEASKQDDWVQCDKCQKWRRLPNEIDVNSLPATWYCKMNRWDKRFNVRSVNFYFIVEFLFLFRCCVLLLTYLLYKYC
jgi:hypothetical protein